MATTQPAVHTRSWPLLVIHGLQAFLVVIVMGVAGYGYGLGIGYFSFLFDILSAVLTIIGCTYILCASTFFSNLYHKYLVFGLHIVFLVLWFFGLALTANSAKVVIKDHNAINKYLSIKDPIGPLGATLVGTSVLVGIEFALWIASLVIIVVRQSRDRTRRSNSEQQTGPFVVKGDEEQKIPLNSISYQQQQPYATTSTLATQYHQSAQGPYTQQQPVYNQQPQPQQQQVAPLPQGHTDTITPFTASPLRQNPTEIDTPKTSGAYTYNSDLPEFAVPQVSLGYHKSASELSVHKQR
ncbi:hypothetical protein B0J11DRAFT_286553 [Dendryphion nanum]|uniref:MARVEL domain-containing protein n=1 Tax=Dendryphion nanum TaxID=256645 RepID=A0A9P9DXD6_9PLEO|nr:hypothetical protein B0J11DRAFT_286553 [Dendryphion nanum]